MCRLAVPASNNYVENGRVYHGFRRGMYMYPCDEVSTAQNFDSCSIFAMQRPF